MGSPPDQFPHHSGSVNGAGSGPPYSPDIPPCVSNISLNDGSDDFSHAFQNMLYVTSAAPAKPTEACTLDPVSRSLPHEPADQHASYMAAVDPRVLSMPLCGGSDGLSHGPRSMPHINVSALGSIIRDVLLTQFLAHYHMRLTISMSHSQLPLMIFGC